jgi:hypothetical protein
MAKSSLYGFAVISIIIYANYCITANYIKIFYLITLNNIKNTRLSIRHK